MDACVTDLSGRTIRLASTMETISTSFAVRNAAPAALALLRSDVRALKTPVAKSRPAEARTRQQSAWHLAGLGSQGLWSFARGATSYLGS